MASVRAWRLATGALVVLALGVLLVLRVCLGSSQAAGELDDGFHALAAAVDPTSATDLREAAYDAAVSHFSDASGSALTQGSLAAVALELVVRLRSGDRHGLIKPMPAVLDRIAAGQVGEARDIWMAFREQGGAASASDGAALVQEFLQRAMMAVSERSRAGRSLPSR